MSDRCTFPGCRLPLARFSGKYCPKHQSQVSRFGTTWQDGQRYTVPQLTAYVRPSLTWLNRHLRKKEQWSVLASQQLSGLLERASATTETVRMRDFRILSPIQKVDQYWLRLHRQQCPVQLLLALTIGVYIMLHRDPDSVLSKAERTHLYTQIARCVLRLVREPVNEDFRMGKDGHFQRIRLPNHRTKRALVMRRLGRILVEDVCGHLVSLHGDKIRAFQAATMKARRNRLFSRLWVAPWSAFSRPLTSAKQKAHLASNVQHVRTLQAEAKRFKLRAEKRKIEAERVAAWRAERERQRLEEAAYEAANPRPRPVTQPETVTASRSGKE